MFNKERGITLVALVVTIVVLLILAGVALSLALNENGLVTRAKNAGSVYNEGAARDNEFIDNVIAQMNALQE